jgi:vancomycin resistance protein VanW
LNFELISIDQVNVMPKLSEVHPIFYQARVQQKRLVRQVENWRNAKLFAREQVAESLPYVCKEHRLILRRKLQGLDQQYQDNKVVNLAIARQPIDGILIRPGETFSFWQRVGKTTAEKGYIAGLQLSKGEIKTGVGGGLCQIANLLYWMALHTPLTVVERHHHSFDPFPDDNRVLPFGSGASIFYNYIDLRFHNPTDRTFQIRMGLDDEYLNGLILADQVLAETYRVFEKNHQFVRQNGKNYRQNEIWRSLTDGSGAVKEELLIKNFAEVKYPLELPV